MKASAEGRLLPAIDELNRPWFTAGEITIQACNACGGLQHPPTEVCGHCQAHDLGWQTFGGEGRVDLERFA